MLHVRRIVYYWFVHLYCFFFLIFILFYQKQLIIRTLYSNKSYKKFELYIVFKIKNLFLNIQAFLFFIEQTIRPLIAITHTQTHTHTHNSTEYKLIY
jgi:hypothetical protein